MLNIGPPELIILFVLLLLVLVPLAVGIISLVDIARRDDEQFAAAGQSRTTWLLVAIFSLVIPCVWLGAAYYLVGIRPNLRRRTP